MGNMHPALSGALIGLGVAIVWVIFEYSMLKNVATRRALQKKTKVELDAQEKKQLGATFGFAIWLPLLFAIGSWLISKFG
jgi:hypothetical protein